MTRSRRTGQPAHRAPLPSDPVRRLGEIASEDFVGPGQFGPGDGDWSVGYFPSPPPAPLCDPGSKSPGSHRPEPTSASVRRTTLKPTLIIPALQAKL